MLVRAALVALWVGAIVAGYGALLRYEGQPGPVAESPTRWPGESPLPRGEGRATLVVVVHPRCACSRSTLRELARLLPELRPTPRVHALMVRPPGVPADWERGDLWRLAESIPGVEVRSDPDGREARRFGAATSGHVFAFDAEGALRYSGGLTVARAHEGQGPIQGVIADVVAGRSRGRFTAASVFGCALFSDSMRSTQ
jgi:hypothetical protein